MQKPRSAVMVVRDNKLLLIERKKGDEPAYFVLPGGGVEAGETPSQAAAREMQEELGVEIEVKSLVKDPEQTDRETWIVRASLTGDAQPEWQEVHKQRPDNSYRVVWAPVEQLGEMDVYPGGAVKLLHPD